MKEAASSTYPDDVERCTLVVTGAGFSVEAGLPVTSAIWSAADRHGSPLLYREFGLKPELLQRVVDDLDEILYRDLALIDRPLRTLDAEEVFETLKEMTHPRSWVCGTNLEQKDSRASKLHLAYESLLYIVFELLGQPYEDFQSIYLGADEIAYPDVPENIARFCGLLPARTVIASTNYDDVLELALLQSHRRWAYGLPVGYHEKVDAMGYAPNRGTFYVWRDSLDMPGGALVWSRCDWRPSAEEDEDATEIILCKLHGSLRWYGCRDCLQVYSLDFWGAFMTHFVDPEVKPWMAEAERFQFRCWNSECARVPYSPVVPPIRDKDLSNPVFRLQWARARLAARRCKSLVLIGTSLRDSDTALLRLVRSAAKRADLVVVVNPSSADISRTERILNRSVVRYNSLAEYVRQMAG